MMVVYHLMFDLDYFGGYAIESTSGFWALFADATAGTFLFLVGVSLAISYSRASAGLQGQSLFWKYLLRGIRILVYAMALTVVFLVLGMGVVAFGILHLIGVYMRIVALSSESPWLLPFGVVPENLVMPDYRPLLPWFGVVLLGVFAGNVLYRNGNRPALFAGKAPSAARPLLPLGRNSLFIYLIHQPILILLLAALGVIEVGFL